MKIIEFFKRHKINKVHKKQSEEFDATSQDTESVPSVEQKMTTFCEECSPVPEEKTHSLLDNKELMKLVEQCCRMYEELDRIQKQIQNANTQEFITMQKSRIKESLILSGATVIDGDTEFSLLRHTPVPMAITKNGTPINETIETGVEIEDRVLIKAKVSLR